MPSLTATWLGQSGFVIRTPGTTIACDLYLSDYCKKRSKLDHTRLLPIPVAPEALTGLDVYLITHAHIDHFDPETVGPAMHANPAMRILCPPSGRKVIAEFFAAVPERFEIIRSGEPLALTPDLRLLALPAAHEELERDETGEFVAFSYLLLFAGLKQALFLAGDTIPYPGQAEAIRQAVPAGYRLVMALPINGRDAARAKLGFKGNLSVEEAAALCRACGAALLLPCHFGMFALNDVTGPVDAARFAALGCRALIPKPMQPIEL